MALVPKDMLEKTQSIQNPVLQQTLKLDEEMKNVLEKKGLSEAKKMQMYGDALGKFLTFYKQNQIMEMTRTGQDIPYEQKRNYAVQTPEVSKPTDLLTPAGSAAKPKSLSFSIPPPPRKTTSTSSRRKNNDLESVRKWLKY